MFALIQNAPLRGPCLFLYFHIKSKSTHVGLEIRTRGGMMVGADESTVLWRPQVITLLIGRNYCKNFVAAFLIDSLSDVKVQLHQFIGFMFFLSYCQK